ncbi:SPOR domain-containing protein [Treponema sp.]|uniref:SPOR domain-containing protein n=1 Tax=Treponema sp. TaxID=166 RepID=UPI0025CD6340|nr:SPOR domain-containing protein [Treponema sp.]MCR5218186.1 SPOR domain-containing protein [Treponema sp.]
MKGKSIFFLLILFSVSSALFAQSQKKSALTLKNEALKKNDLNTSIEYLLSNADNTATSADKRALLYLAAGLLEESQLYDQAADAYVKAAAISAGNAQGMPEVTNEEIVLCAVRASLAAGSFETAESYLNSAVRSSKDSKVQAYVNLYSAWVSLCRIKEYSQASDTLELLKAYASMSSMKEVRHLVVFTLWYVTGKSMYADILKSEYPSSPEALIVQGKINLAPVPFWLYMVRNVSQTEDTAAVKNDSEKSKVQSEENKDSDKVERQLGLFRNRQNALDLTDALKKKGFDAYIIEDVRSSGTKYHIVVVAENAEGTMGLKLKDAGYESYILQ